MGTRTVQCAKLGRQLPALDEATPEGRDALKFAQLVGGPEFRQRVFDHISVDAWRLWKDHMRMVINEFHLDPTSAASNAVLHKQMEAFLFGPGSHVPGYVPPDQA
jgi:Fe-S cluster biosynthesis and repair protein YggX